MLNLRKAIITSFMYYAVTFLLASMIILIPSFSAGILYNLGVWAIIAITIYFLAINYYFTKKVRNPVNEGFMLGLVAVIFSILIEIPLMVYGFAANLGWAWFYQWELWAGSIVLILAAIYGAMNK